MANYYTRFSVMLPLGSPDRIEPALEIYRTLAEDLYANGVSTLTCDRRTPFKRTFLSAADAVSFDAWMPFLRFTPYYVPTRSAGTSWAW